MRLNRVFRCYLHEGFSIFDVMAAISLAGIVSLVTLPQISAVHRQYQLLGAANQLGFEISRARMQAVGQNKFVRIRMLGDNRYVRERSSDGVNYAQDGPAMGLPSGIAATFGAGGAPGFDRSGIASAETTITLRNNAGQKTIRTNVLGRVTIS